MSDQHSEHGNIPWREWGDEAFAEAKAQDKPVLLDIGAVWCHWCHVMDTGIPGDPDHTGTYSNLEVQKRIADGFIPIKVDNDRRPDINARYNMGGWPTTAFLTPDGDALYGETYVPPPRMVALLDYISDLYRNSNDTILEQAAQMRRQRADSEALTASDLDPDTTATVITAIKRNFDPVHGGFTSSSGSGQPKFPHPDALRLTLEEYARTGDPELRAVAEKTLHGMADGGMYDQFAGGFFRYSTTRDWSVPHFEKMLEDNAKLTSVYALASQVLDDPHYLEVVKTAQNWLMTDMRDPKTGAFVGSQDADKEEAYYGKPLAVRATLPTPFIDRTIYTGWNALMVSALVARYKMTGESDILEAAQKAFSFFGPSKALHEDYGVGLVHCYVGGEPQEVVGLLIDQTPALQAALDLYEATADRYYRYAAKMLGNFITDQVDADGGLLDSMPDDEAIGELARPKKEIGDNADAALALIRLSGFTEDAKYRQAAERALRLFADKFGDYGYFASSYARAVDAARAPGLHVTIVGDRDDERTRLLQRAAWGHVAPGKTVETLGAEAATKRGLPADKDGLPYATVCLGTVCQAPVADAEEMRGQMRTHPGTSADPPKALLG